eukprot:2829099-Pyramimonas_sp.AAC.1
MVRTRQKCDIALVFVGMERGPPNRDSQVSNESLTAKKTSERTATIHARNLILAACPHPRSLESVWGLGR